MPVPIHTLHLPTLSYRSRSEFLALRQRFVVESALQNSESYLRNGCNASHFHKAGKDTGFGVPLIHIIDKSGLFTLRAYGQEAVRTLQFWRMETERRHPHVFTSSFSQDEMYLLDENQAATTYQSQNYIPFSKCGIADGYFMDLEKTEIDPKSALQSRLIGNLRTFFRNLGVSDNGMDTRFRIMRYPTKAEDYIALYSGGKSIYKKAFALRVETNLLLPHYFSLGQNVGYGCGVFERCFNKTRI